MATSVRIKRVHESKNASRGRQESLAILKSQTCRLINNLVSRYASCTIASIGLIIHFLLLLLCSTYPLYKWVCIVAMK